MVETPWGDAAKLKRRKLRPGRGTPREEAKRNQRERLFAALVATVEDGLELPGDTELAKQAFETLFQQIVAQPGKKCLVSRTIS